MRKRGFDQEEQDYINANYLKLSSRQMADHLGCSRSKVQYFMRHNNLEVPDHIIEEFRVAALRGRTVYTQEQDQYIKEHYLKLPIKTIAKNIGGSFTGVTNRLSAMGLEVPKKLAQQRKQSGCFKKGMEPMNKGKKQHEYMSNEAIERTKSTRFQKGDLPHNTKYDGYERISKDGYREVRVKCGKFKLMHRKVWEEHHGKVPKGHCVAFKDGNPLNCDIENLELITRGENMKRNTLHQYPQEVQQNIKLLNKLKKQLNHD